MASDCDGLPQVCQHVAKIHGAPIGVFSHSLRRHSTKLHRNVLYRLGEVDAGLAMVSSMNRPGGRPICVVSATLLARRMATPKVGSSTAKRHELHARNLSNSRSRAHGNASQRSIFTCWCACRSSRQRS